MRDFEEIHIPIAYWSWFSGTGNLAWHFYKRGLPILFPVDLRCGWDITRDCEQGMLDDLSQLLEPTLISMEPCCQYWSVAGRTRNDEIIVREREAEKGLHEFPVGFIRKNVSSKHKHKRLFLVENPQSSAIWRESELKNLNLNIENDFSQCAHSTLSDGQRSQKWTRIKSNFKLKSVLKPCKCKNGHRILTGKNTSRAAAFSDGLCESLVDDCLNAMTAEECYPVRKHDELLYDAQEQLRPGRIKTSHLPCPYCDNRFSSSQTLRYHKMTQHNQEYNSDRISKGQTPIANPLSVKRRRGDELQAERLLPELSTSGDIDECHPAGESTSLQAQPPSQSHEIEDIETDGNWHELPTSQHSRVQPQLRDQGTWQAVEEPTELRRPPRAIVKNSLRKVQRHKDKPYGGDLKRVRELIGKRLLQRLRPTTNPVEAEEVPVGSDEDLNQHMDTEEPGDSSVCDPFVSMTRLNREQVNGNSENSESKPQPKRQPQQGREPDHRKRKHKDDLPPYTDDMFAHLTAEDIPDWNTDDLLVGNDADLPPEARRCPVDVRRMIRNAHNNLGHPSNHALVRLMKTAKCHPDMIAYARHMKCPSCARRVPPARIPKVSMPYRPTRFNAVVGLDLKWVKDSVGTTFYLLNILDLATAFNVCCVLTDKTPESVTTAFKECWMSWAGVPEKVVADKGTEYYTVFQEMLSNNGIQYRVVPVESPWQHGMVERHGAVLADIIKSVATEKHVQGYKAMKDVAMHACMAKNRRPGRTGYSPRTLIFGIDERLIASGLSHYLENPDDASVAEANNDPDFKRSMELRRAAMKTVVDLDHSEKWKDAIKFPSRKAECAYFLPGHQVFFWKKSNQPSNLRGKRARLVERWYGPAVVVGHEWDGDAQRDSYWVSYGGKCFLVAGTHMRHAEFEECLTHEKFVEEMKKAFDNVQTPTFQYADVRRDQVDPDAGDQEEQEGLLSRMARTGSEVPFETHSRTSHAPGWRNQEPPGRDVERTPRRRVRSPSYTPTSERQEPEREDIPPTPFVPQGDQEEAQEVFVTKKKQKCNQTVFQLRHHESVLIVDNDTNECYFLKWKTFNKMQRKGKELDPRYFDAKEKGEFYKSDAKEWQSFLDTGAVVVIPPNDAYHIPKDRIFSRAARYVRTNKALTEEEGLIAKSRIVLPGDVDPDGDVPVEEGGFRTDAPTCPQVAFHLLCSQAVLKKRKIGSFDCKTAFLTGKGHDRDIYCRPPREGLPGVEPGSLLKIVKGAYGLREAPRLWYLRAREILLEAGFEEMQAAKACFCLYENGPKGERKNVGMLVLHVDDAAFAGEGPVWKKAMQYLRSKFTIGKEEYDDFTFLGRHVHQNKDFSIDIDQHEYVKGLESVKVSRERRGKGKSPLTAKELHDYRSIVGQLAWPARESMPQLAYAVSDLQQKVAQGSIAIGKIVGKLSGSNVLTKHVSGNDVAFELGLLSQMRCEGRHPLAPRSQV